MRRVAPRKSLIRHVAGSFQSTRLTAKLTKRGRDVLLDLSDGKLERLRRVGARLAVEHFDPAAKYPREVTHKGSGLIMKK